MFWFRSDGPGFCLGTSLLVTIMLLMYTGGFQASLTLGPGGDLPQFIDVLLYGFSHDELLTLLVSIVLLLLVGGRQEHSWGTVPFLSLSSLTVIILPLLYTLVLFVSGGEATRICGYSAIQLALFTAQCRQVTQRRLLRCLPVWLLPWLFLFVAALLLPGTPVLFHFCAICIGHSYHQSFIGTLQELDTAVIFRFIPNWAYVPTSARSRLPTYFTSWRSRSLPQWMPVDQAAVASDVAVFEHHHHPWVDTVPARIMKDSTEQFETEVLEEQMLRAGILASLQDNPDNPDEKVEVPKSSVSSLRLQQLEKMGFPTNKAVVALAASKQLDGAISLLIDDSIGEQAVVVTKGKYSLSL